MKPVTLYSNNWCPYCADAKALLNARKIPFTDIDITSAPAKRDEMIARASGRTTVPQIFIGETHIGGCDDLYSLDAEGGLAPLLAA